MSNIVRTLLLMIVLTVLFVWIGGTLGGRQGAVAAFVAAGAMNFFAYWFSDKLVLKQYRAQQAEPGSRLYRIVESLAQKAGLPMPNVYIIPERSPNAFATGRNPGHAAVAATAGILDILDDDELEGVMAHELAHVRNRDILTGTIVATLAGALAMMGRFAGSVSSAHSSRRRQNPLAMIFILIGAPLAGLIIRSMISRTREFAADAGGASISGKPLRLADALRKISRVAQARPLTRSNDAHAHLFIVYPFSGGLQKLFATHPPMEDRIQRLAAIAREDTFS